MTIRAAYGIDPDEVWEMDFCVEMARTRAQLEHDVATRLARMAGEERDAVKRESLQQMAAQSEAKAQLVQGELAGYVPESGPVFTVGAIPGRKRAELLGRHQELDAMPEGTARAVGVAEWSRDVVASAVKGHRGLRTRSGKEIPFALEAGLPSARTLDAYAPILEDLAWVVLTQQRLGADGKNA